MKKIRNKVLIILVLVTLIPVLLIGGYSLYSSSKVLRENVLSSHINTIDLLQERISNLVNNVDSDILYLRDSNALHLYLSSTTTEGSHTQQLLLKNLRSSFNKFSKQKKIYQQVRFLGTNGKEVIRVERNDDKSTSITEIRLKNRSKEKYFAKSIDLKKGKIYISPFVLNHKVDNTTGEQPTIRYATPIFDRKNDLRGVIILDIDGSSIKKLAKKQDRANQQLLIVDNNGHYIYHSDRRKEWGVNHSDNASFNKDMPKLKAYLNKKSNDTYTESDENIVVHQAINLSNQQHIGTIFSIEKKSAIFKPLKRNILVYFAIFIVSLILSWLLAIVLTNSIVRPLVNLKQQVKNFSMGEIDAEIKVSTKDEVGELAHAIELLRKSMKILMKRSRQ
ncbi:MAG: HAMP domain-containing protein [Thiotrichaceae bacterium]|nr:HAMP domain-containing protein [Thiotrichaceae bacterium]